jgi:acrylyl-CoA reductase (NADPH)
LATGSGLGEETDGGYAEFTRVAGKWVIPMPDGLDARSSMTIGTAGFTAALAVHRMEHNGQTPDMGPIVVTGATGGVGSIAVDILSSRGYEVVAVSGKRESEDYLHAIGATRILWRDELDLGKRPLEGIEWAGAIDNVGGEMLTWLTRTTGWWGNIASIGLASSHELNTTVLPFILRGVNLLGINSMATPRELRLAVWDRIAGDLMPQHLDVIGTREIALDDLPGAFQAYVDGTVTGRTVVRIR